MGADAVRSSERLPGLLPVCGTAIVLTVAAYVARLWLLRVRDFDPDEFEHLHAGWLFANGMLPYRDFFQIHPPWFYFLLRPLFHFFAVETNAADAFGLLF